MLNWLKPFSIFCYLDNNDYNTLHHSFDCLVAAGVKKTISTLDEVNKQVSEGCWLFGHLSYDLKDQFFPTQARKSPIDFPPLFFFEPELLLKLTGNNLQIEADDPNKVWESILRTSALHMESGNSIVKTKPRQLKDQYLEAVKALKHHIHRGDCYEVNYCTEFFAENVQVEPHPLFQKLVEFSPNPFSAFCKLNDKFLMCASPERFLKKEGDRIFSQPIKGTIRRNRFNNQEDELLKQQLLQSRKDQSENVMIVDLVRNDLTKVCKEASVKVDELFGIYSFPQVHQMISTVSGALRDGVQFADIVRACFPMGSMTGAPKHRVIQLIEGYEVMPRNIFSGSVGYISPNGNFDFNVVIRSIMFNQANRYLSYMAGGAITFQSQPEQEWEECLLKTQAIKKVLTQ